MNAAACHNIIVDCLISHSDWIFPGGKNKLIITNKKGVYPLLIQII